MPKIKISEGDHKIQQSWLEQHKAADMIEYDTASGLPRRAIYLNPIYQAYVAEPRVFFLEVARLMGE